MSAGIDPPNERRPRLETVEFSFLLSICGLSLDPVAEPELRS